LKFAARLKRLTVWQNVSQLSGMMVRIDHGEPQTLHESSLRAPIEIEKAELYVESLSFLMGSPLKADAHTLSTPVTN
jgi:hypothetical protein